MATDIEQDISEFTKTMEELLNLVKTVQPGATTQEVQTAAARVKEIRKTLKELQQTLFKVQRSIAVTQDVITQANRGLRAIASIESRNEPPSHSDWQELSTQIKGMRAQIQFDTVVEAELLGTLKTLADDASNHFLSASASQPPVRQVFLELLKGTLTTIRAYEDVLFVKLGDLMVNFN